MKAILASKAIPIGLCTLGWYHIYRFDPEKYRNLAYNKGRELTLKYSTYRGWDAVVEPMIVRQIHFIFSVGDAFVKGLTSDNVVKQKSMAQEKD